jgi:hypothetical protein
MVDPIPFPTRPAGPIEAPLFYFGDRVAKVGGDYRFDGEIRGVVTKLSGALRYVVEDDRGVLHVFSAKQLARRDAAGNAPATAHPLAGATELGSEGHTGNTGKVLSEQGKELSILPERAGNNESETAPPVPDWVGDFINRRTGVENELRAMAADERPLPTAEDCRRMADTLGIPSPFLRRYPPLAARPEPKEWR